MLLVYIRYVHFSSVVGRIRLFPSGAFCLLRTTQESVTSLDLLHLTGPRPLLGRDEERGS